MVQQLERPTEAPQAVDLRPIVTEEPSVSYKARLDSYYDYPSIKSPEWKWQVPTYFFTGGIAAGAYIASTLAELFGTDEDRPVSRAGYLIALLFTAISPILLIVDLGRPRRFLHMLRVLKLRSPMNLGSWGLSGFGLFTVLSIARLIVEEGLVGPSSPIARIVAWAPLRFYGLLGSLFAFFVGSYTGLLLSFTNVPVWAKNRLLQGPLFVASAMSTGMASISLALSLTGAGNKRTERWLSSAENVSNLGEIALTAGSIATLGRLARPLEWPPYGSPFWLGAVGLGMVAPIVLRRRAMTSSGAGKRRLLAASSSAALIGGLFFRLLETYAGQEQARKEPTQYLQYTSGHR